MVVSKSPFKICLIDLCFCLNYKKETPDSVIGTIGYISPEILFKNKVLSLIIQIFGLLEY